MDGAESSISIAIYTLCWAASADHLKSLNQKTAQRTCTTDENALRSEDALRQDFPCDGNSVTCSHPPQQPLRLLSLKYSTIPTPQHTTVHTYQAVDEARKWLQDGNLIIE